jgi:hypothetical protein
LKKKQKQKKQKRQGRDKREEGSISRLVNIDEEELLRLLRWEKPSRYLREEKREGENEKTSE